MAICLLAHQSIGPFYTLPFRLLRTVWACDITNAPCYVMDKLISELIDYQPESGLDNSTTGLYGGWYGQGTVRTSQSLHWPHLPLGIMIISHIWPTHSIGTFKHRTVHPFGLFWTIWKLAYVKLTYLRPIGHNSNMCSWHSMNHIPIQGTGHFEHWTHHVLDISACLGKLYCITDASHPEYH